MWSIAVSVLFVIAGLWVRRRYGGLALAGLALALATLSSIVAAGSFIAMMRAIETPAAGIRFTVEMMVVLHVGAYGGAALLIQLTRRNDGPWLSAWGVAFGVIGFLGGAVLAFVVILAAIAFGLAHA